MWKIIRRFVSSVLRIFRIRKKAGGPGRYTMRANIDRVRIGLETYMITRQDSDLYIAGHELTRGIYRENLPWLYVHHIEDDTVDITFEEEGMKAPYPLYTGADMHISSNELYDHPWEMRRSTCIAFEENYWLIAHRWSDTGIYFDLQHQIGDETMWEFVGETFVEADGSGELISEISTHVKIDTFSAQQRRAIVVFTTQ
ncbi:hypothetical protein ACFLXE_06445 [Chloroflexota bacterium]